MLTVGQLIEQLQKMPGSAPVSVYGQVPSKPFSQDRTVVDTYVKCVKQDPDDEQLIFITI